jgi:lipopolysaccharide exporter
MLANISKLVTGTVISQGINILASPFLSRIFSPAEFGVSTLFQSILSIVLIVATLKLDSAIIITDSDIKAKQLLKSSLFFTLICSFLVFVTFFVLLFMDLDIFGVSNGYIVIILLSISLLLSGSSTTFNSWANRNRDYSIMMWVPIFNTGTATTVNIFLGIIGSTSYGLIPGIVGGLFISSTYLYFRYGIPKIKHSNLETVREFSDFPAFQMPSLLLNTLSTQIPVIAFSFFYNEIIVGWYSMAQRILLLPLTVIGSAVGQIYYREISILYQKHERIDTLTNKILKNSFIIAFIPMTILIAFGDIIFVWIFGESWEESGTFARYLTPWFLMVFVTSPLSNILIVLNKQKENLKINTIMMLSRVLSIWIGANVFDTYSSTILLFGCVGFVLWYILSIYFVYLAGLRILKYVLFSTIYFAGMIFIGMVLRLIIHF